jgi:hypothetical protein
VEEKLLLEEEEVDELVELEPPPPPPPQDISTIHMVSTAGQSRRGKEGFILLSNFVWIVLVYLTLFQNVTSLIARY